MKWVLLLFKVKHTNKQTNKMSQVKQQTNEVVKIIANQQKEQAEAKKEEAKEAKKEEAKKKREEAAKKKKEEAEAKKEEKKEAKKEAKKVEAVEAVEEREEEEEEEKKVEAVEEVEEVEESDEESEEEEDTKEAWRARALKAEAEVKRLKAEAAPVKQVKVKQVCAYCQKAIGRKKSHQTTCGHVFHAECYGVLTCLDSVCPTCQEVQPPPVKPVKKGGGGGGAPKGGYPEDSKHLLGLTAEQEALMRGVYNGEYTLKWADVSIPIKKVTSKCYAEYERAKGATTLAESKRLGLPHTEVARGYRNGYCRFFKDGVEAPPFK